MGNIYVTCARCNKGMMIAEYNCVFCSDIDNQFVCADCYKKEQPKELMKQITDLEAKLDEKTRVAEGYSELFDKRQHENYEQFCEIQELKAKLAESEKAFDTICSKYEKKSKQIFETIKCQEECSDAYNLLSKENEQLKHKIEESENFYKDLGFKDEKDARDYLIDCITQPKDLVEDVRKLKNQLTEKDKVIENLRIDLKDWQDLEEKLGNKYDKVVEKLVEEKNRNKKLNHEAQKYYEDAYCNGFQNKKAISELESLKNYLPNIALDIPDMVSYRYLKKQIDQQIAKLKGER